MALDTRLPLLAQGPDLFGGVQRGIGLGQKIQAERRTQEAFPLLQAGRQAGVDTAQLGLAQERGLAVVNTLKAIRALPIERRAQAVQRAIPQLRQLGVSESSIASQGITDADLDAEIAAGSGFLQQVVQTAGQREFANLTEGFTPEEIAQTRRIKAGLDPRSVGSAAQTIAGAGTTEDVAASEAIIRERVKFGEMTGSSRAKTIDKGFESIQKIDKNIINMGRAIAAIDAGASTGVIESRFFPSFRESTLRLEALQKELALDVIGAVTFGALSKGELDLAQEVALPLNLEPAALKQELLDRIAAQQKLRGYYQEQIDFLDQGGSIAGFLRSKRRGQPQPEAAPQPAQPTNAVGGQGGVKFLGFE